MFDLDRRLLGIMRSASVNFTPVIKMPISSLACGGCKGTCKGTCANKCKGMCTGCKNTCKGRCKGTRRGK
jgi:modification target Cys-rich repeat protein